MNVSFLGLVDPDTQCFLDADRLHAQFARAGALSAGRVINYCGGAIAASATAFVLSLLGKEDVALYDGSMTEWAADPSLPLVLGDT